MNWGTIIFVLFAIAQGYAKWRKKQADQAKRGEATAAKRNAVPQAQSQDLQSDQAKHPEQSAATGAEDISTANAGSPWMPGDRDPERGGGRLLAQARTGQVTAGVGGAGGVEPRLEPIAGNASSALGQSKSSSGVDVDLLLEGFGLEAGDSRVSPNARIEDLEGELNLLRQRQSTLLRNWKKLRDERDALAMRLEGSEVAPVPAGGPVTSEGLVDRLKSPLGAREAFVVAEILGPPVGSKRSGAQSLHN